MVWFQCEDCGENLKKPKLPNHFRICSAFKFSCIDCGVTFDQQNVQGHTQCITEAEKYGPKGDGKTSNGVTAKPKADAKQQSDVDIHVGLSERPPWFCSLCNTQATSRQTLLLHADGKKHRAKARAFHAAKQPKQDVFAPDTNVPAENTLKSAPPPDKQVEGQKTPVTAGAVCIDHEVHDGDAPSKKKRKLDAIQRNGAAEKSGDDSSGEVGNGEVIQVEKANISSSFKEENKKKIKWKKLITSALKSDSNGVLKMRKLRKHVLRSLRESGITDDEAQLMEKLEQKMSSSSKFIVDNEYVRLAVKA
ncbi:UBP1-associated proteins 1C [Tripterygium wilfordii]|uniref:UBP1-associated proteins 1C n=1 Tax=Tripterygium wilfordii TaxID=458696 RepID=A0A7J7DQK2_TRIWF|nr:UBP1-associated proteins 1C [Tripterygium wilfordii]KAF5748454.1 UBP1-associated proteins 1C [Tripterygium wilfordii]